MWMWDDTAEQDPNDSEEQNRLNRQHQLLTLLLDGSLSLAPVSGISRVIDAGTGT